MIDKIMKLDDFQKVIEEKKLDRKDLRVCIFEESADKFGVYLDISIVLTIADNNHIIEWRATHRNTRFFRDKGSKEQKAFLEWRDKTNKDIKKRFGKKIIDGNWSFPKKR